jgi:pyridoxal phosphate enzyme (YggS family)
VSKTFGPDHVRAALAAGQLDFGENRVQEAVEKMAAVPHANVRWHFIGHLQSNKAKKAAGSFACIHTVDSLALLEKLDAGARELGVGPDVLVQVDLANEPTKFGAVPDHVPQILDGASGCTSVKVMGLMTIPPWSERAEDARPYFRRLRQVRDRLDPNLRVLTELSMGMSHDLEVAIEEGATLVRVGTAIFGARG